MEYKWICQDEDGDIYKYIEEPYFSKFGGHWWHKIDQKYMSEYDDMTQRNPNWEKSIINLETHDYKIEDGILISIPKPTPCKYADIFIEAAEDSSKVLQIKVNGGWSDVSVHNYEYRIKPKPRKVRFYNYIDHEGNIKVSIDTPPPSALWIGEVQNVEL